jgi:hypothetical protein
MHGSAGAKKLKLRLIVTERTKRFDIKHSEVLCRKGFDFKIVKSFSFLSGGK